MDGVHASTDDRVRFPIAVPAGCAPAGQRMTPIRQAMLDILGREGRPLRAYDLIPRLEAACGRRFQAQTIYRTLDFLLKEGLALRIESWNAYIARPAAGPDHALLFLLCGLRRRPGRRQRRPAGHPRRARGHERISRRAADRRAPGGLRSLPRAGAVGGAVVLSFVPNPLRRIPVTNPVPGGQRLPVSLLTGFLGSGKTTVLNHLLHHPDMTRTVVIVNEFGEIGLDHDLIAQASDDLVLLKPAEEQSRLSGRVRVPPPTRPRRVQRPGWAARRSRSRRSG